MMTVGDLRELLENYGDEIPVGIRLNVGGTNEHAYHLNDSELSLSRLPDAESDETDSIFYIEISSEDRIY